MLSKLMSKILVDETHQIRYEFKIITFWLVAILLGGIFGLLFQWLVSGLGSFWSQIAFFQGISIGFVFASFGAWYFLSSTKDVELTVGLMNFKWFRFIEGLGLGIFLVIIVVTVGWIFGHYSFIWSIEKYHYSEIVFSFLTVSMYLLFPAIIEELMFRGFPLQVNRNQFNILYRILLLSTIFMLMHFFNSHITILALFNIFLAGIWLSWATLSRNTLWYAAGLHFGWNMFQVAGLGSSVSGNELQVIPILQMSTNTFSPEWLSGGNFGIEGSIITTIIISGAGFYEYWRTRES